MMKSVAYDCLSCGNLLGPFKDVSGGGLSTFKPSLCPNCQSMNFKINSQKTEYGNYQKITLQESPGTVSPFHSMYVSYSILIQLHLGQVPAGRVPRYKDVILTSDLVDIARPGEEIIVTGLYVHSVVGLSKDKNGFPGKLLTPI